MPTPTASSGTLPVTRVAEYLHSDPRKTALALQHLAGGGYLIRVSVNPDRWVRVVPVEVGMIGGVARPLSQKAAQQ
jgi:hypothetical protein